VVHLLPSSFRSLSWQTEFRALTWTLYSPPLHQMWLISCMETRKIWIGKKMPLWSPVWLWIYYLWPISRSWPKRGATLHLQPQAASTWFDYLVYYHELASEPTALEPGTQYTWFLDTYHVTTTKGKTLPPLASSYNIINKDFFFILVWIFPYCFICTMISPSAICSC